YGGEGGGVHALGALASVHGDEFVNAELEAGKHHAPVAGTGSPTNGLGFEDGNFGSALGEGTGGGKARVASADHRNVYVAGQRASIGFRYIDGGQPEIVLLHDALPMRVFNTSAPPAIAGPHRRGRMCLPTSLRLCPRSNWAAYSTAVS